LYFVVTAIAQPSQGAGDVIDSNLRPAIQKEYPGAIIVGSKDIDTTSCYAQRGHPGWVNGDFNGDGQPDYAVLFMVRTPEKGPEIVMLRLAVFLRQANDIEK
jgi:hypothetical protein